MNKFKNIINLTLLVSLMPAILYAAAETKKAVETTTTSSDHSSCPTFDLREKINGLLLSPKVQPNLITPAHREKYLTCFKAMQADPDYFNPTNNAIAEEQLPLFKDINEIINQHIAWSFIRRVNLEPQKLESLGRKSTTTKEAAAKIEKEYDELFKKKVNELSDIESFLVYNTAIKTACTEFHRAFSFTSIVKAEGLNSGLSRVTLKKKSDR